jgi:hypothetical protein
LANKNLFLKLAEVFNGNQEIERFASQELIANAHTPLVLGSGKPLASDFINTMQYEYAHTICSLILEIPFDWAPPETSNSRLYKQHSIFKAHVELLGPDGLVHSNKVRIGLYGMLPHSEYGIRTHPAEEIYIMLAGNCLWKRGAQAYQLAGVGGRSYHPSMLPHATKTEQSAFMSVYLWAGDLSKKQYSYDGLPDE